MKGGARVAADAAEMGEVWLTRNVTRNVLTNSSTANNLPVVVGDEGEAGYRWYRVCFIRAAATANQCPSGLLSKERFLFRKHILRVFVENFVLNQFPEVYPARTQNEPKFKPKN